ncbi:RNA pyrophosphohydrolase [Hansschlegelia sp. KR7-227]|uniref:RNA pyrophosphohydrolase n=1 Tax=Hansschlegelia sp. KR7-227 TaxID=3400914 RepID=UPI003BFA9DFA
MTVAPAPERLPYRRCVGVMLLNGRGGVFVGKRRGGGDGDPDRMEYRWQMPQGGIDAGETPLEAARRELIEETGVRSAELIAEAPDWYDYEFPPDVLARARNGRYGGQTQRWFAFRFTGDESEIDLSPPGHKPEFSGWRWAEMAELPGLIVPFKRGVYERVVEAFGHLAG